MSDFSEHRDYKFDDDSGGRRRKRRSRQARYDDDAWGMAYYGDMSDGARADIEDWAAGMVDEESRRYRDERRNRRDQETLNYGDDLDDLDRPDLGNRSSSGRPSNSRYRSTRGANRRYDDFSDSSAMSRADRLRQRFNRGSGQRGYVEGSDRPGIYEEQERKQKPSGGGGDFFDALFDFKVDTLPETISSVVVIAVIAIILVSIACIGAAWLTAIEVRSLLNLT